MFSTKVKVALFAGGAVLLVAAVLFALNRTPGGGGVGRVQQLSDGSTLEIRQVTFAKDFQYKHQSGNRVQRFIAPLAPVLPAFIKNRFLSLSGGSLGFGGEGNTNLFVITVNRSRAPSWWSDLRRLAVFDDQGNAYDACWGASTLGMPGEVAHGWQIQAFPRRSAVIGLRFFSHRSGGQWEVAAESRIANPVFRDYPQWKPEPRAVTKSDGDLAVTLSEFQSGAPFRFADFTADDNMTPQKTRLVFDLQSNGASATNWAVQKIVISDATGNQWSPLFVYGLGTVTNGTVEFGGALWPGENAWKLDVEFVRTGGFAADEVWEAPPLAIPTVGVNTNLNATFQRDGMTVRLIGLAAPQTDHPEPFKWIAKYWGNEDKDKIISLTVQLSPGLGKQRLKLLRAVDQNGHEAQLVEHRNEDYAQQALLLKPTDGAREMRLTFALQRSRFVQFLARPDFVATGPTNKPPGQIRD